jgi:hypothetical protein
VAWPDDARVAVENALVSVQDVLRLVEAGRVVAERDDAESLRAAVHSLRLIADRIDRGGDGVMFP